MAKDKEPAKESKDKDPVSKANFGSNPDN